MEVVCVGLVGAQENLQAEGCTWLEHWLLPQAAGMVISWGGHEFPGTLCCTRSIGFAWLCSRLHGDALVHAFACYSLFMTTKAVLRQPLPLWQQILVHTCVCRCFALEEQWKLSAGCRALRWVTALLGKGWSKVEFILQQCRCATPLARWEVSN